MLRYLVCGLDNCGVDLRKIKTFSQLCRHKNYGTIFPALLIEVKLESVLVYNFLDPKTIIQLVVENIHTVCAM